MSVASLIETLEAAAKGASAAEATYRREAAERIRTLERERSFAYRRVNLMKSIADAAARAESEEMAIGAGQAILRAKLGWAGDSDVRSAVLTRFAMVAQALFANLHPPADHPPADHPPADQPPADQAPADVLSAIKDFEAWYEVTHRTSFWDLFDQPMPETPLVDF